MYQIHSLTKLVPYDQQLQSEAFSSKWTTFDTILAFSALISNTPLSL